MGKGRAPCCDRSKVKKGVWSPEEDLKLANFIEKYGHTNWRSLPNKAGLLRCGKSCRLRWINYLRPDLKRGEFTKNDEEAIIKLQSKLGNKWSKIASYFPGRTDNEIKNVWNTNLKKRLIKDEIKDLSKPSSFSGCSSSSSFSVHYPERNQETKDGIEEKTQESNESNENSCLLNPSNAVEYCSNSYLIDADFMQSEDTNIITNNAYQENLEMYLNQDLDIGNFPLEAGFDFLDLLDKEDPIDMSQSQTKEFETRQSNSDYKNELMKWMKDLENEIQVNTDDGGNQILSQDANIESYQF